jgi:hypothetical protein
MTGTAGSKLDFYGNKITIPRGGVHSTSSPKVQSVGSAGVVAK